MQRVSPRRRKALAAWLLAACCSLAAQLALPSALDASSEGIASVTQGGVQPIVAVDRLAKFVTDSAELLGGVR